MTATAPRSSARSRACPSAATPSAASGGPWACRPSAAAGPASTAPAARATRPWAASSSSTAARSTGSARARPCCLLGAIDDATSTVLALHFRPAEDLHGYLTLLQQIAAQHGLPVTLYGDRLGVFVRNDAHWSLEEELQGAQHPTHFGQILRDLGIGYIAAHSPRPRAASSASGTLCKIASSPSSACTASPPSRRPRPSCPPTSPTTTAASPSPRPSPRPRGAARRAISPTASSCRYTRRVARDNTVRLGPRLVQIPRGPHGRSYAGCRVEVRECLDGRLLVDYQGRRLVTAPRRRARFVLVPRRGATPPRLQERV